MKLLDVVQQVLETQVLPMTLERQLYKLLGTKEFNAMEMAAIDELLEALSHGMIRPVA